MPREKKAKVVNGTELVIIAANKSRLARKAIAQANKFEIRAKQLRALANERTATAQTAIAAVPTECLEANQAMIGTLVPSAAEVADADEVMNAEK